MKKNIVIVILLIFICCLGLGVYNKKNAENLNKNSIIDVKQAENQEFSTPNEYALTDNYFSKFDFSFLKFENQKENKIYSPLSIKYTFKMLEEATTGDAEKQISSIINTYQLTEYKSNSKMALANAFFIRDSYKNNIKQDYINTLKTKYNADIEFDSFSNAKKINNWVKNHTLNLIPDLLEDSDVSNLNLALVNALGIDLEWNHKFLKSDYEDDENIKYSVEYYHEKLPNETWSFNWIADEVLYNKKFDDNQSVSSMKVYASLNNYDIVKELGNDKIRERVYLDFKDWALGEGNYTEYNGRDDEIFNNDLSDSNIKKVFDKWFDTGTTSLWEGDGKSYIDELNENYGRVDYSTDFSIYVDDDVKVFSKDLEETDGTTLEYIGIMPIKQELNSFIDSTDFTNINNYIKNLKELKKENFKDGYLTYIHGYIPKFSFEYELNLKEDLKKMGVTDVFEEEKANLTKMTDDSSMYIESAKHKANIEFTQDGIKAAAATMVGGAGAGDWYDYFFEMPTEEIDITFDKPYMFLIRDKKTGETWFVGTVYEPLDASEETNEIFDVWEDREEN